MTVFTISMGQCQDCKHWGANEEWSPYTDDQDSRGFAIMRHCNNPRLLMASAHCAYPDYYGPPTTHPEFGCVQFEAKGAE